MSTVVLRKPVKGKKRITYTKKPELRASVCDACGKVFDMQPFCNDQGLARLHGTFDTCAMNPDTGKSDGNGFNATVCSFRCAHKLMNGGWKRLKDYAHFVKEKAVLARGECTISVFVRNENELVHDWEASDDLQPKVY